MVFSCPQKFWQCTHSVCAQIHGQHDQNIFGHRRHLFFISHLTNHLSLASTIWVLLWHDDDYRVHLLILIGRNDTDGYGSVAHNSRLNTNELACFAIECAWSAPHIFQES